MSIKQFISQQKIQHLIKVLSYGNHKFMFVGGCCRNLLANLPVTDIDIASTYTPQQNAQNLQKQGIKVINTGMQFGTITAIINHTAYEITTLRADINPNGRHTKVQYTTSFKKDSTRRDFTFNALYLNPFTGEITDYFNGIDHLKANKVQFIGNAYKRITEDNLRILRYFRFYNQFGKSAPSPSLLKTLQSTASLVSGLSVHRTSTELTKMLQNTKNLQNTFTLMHKTNVLRNLINYNPKRIALINTLISLCMQFNIKHSNLIYALLCTNLHKNYILNTKVDINHINILINLITQHNNKNFNINTAYKVAVKYSFNVAIQLALLLSCIRQQNFNKIIIQLQQLQNIHYPFNGNSIKQLTNNSQHIGILLNYAKVKYLQNNKLSTQQILQICKKYYATSVRFKV